MPFPAIAGLNRMSRLGLVVPCMRRDAQELTAEQAAKQ